eukprot:11192366-Lingulodinium_polyedra.AAC.1
MEQEEEGLPAEKETMKEFAKAVPQKAAKAALGWHGLEAGSIASRTSCVRFQDEAGVGQRK